MKIQYLTAAKAILDWTTHEKLRPGAIIPSTRSLAKKLGYTPFTIQRACQNLITAGVLRRKGYTLILGSGTLSTPSVAGTVYIVSYYDAFSRAVERILTERGVNHRRIDLNCIKHLNPLPVLRKIIAGKPAGIIFWMSSWIDSMKAVLESSSIPIVVCADGAPALNCTSAQMDVCRGLEMGVRHLFDLGHRHIAHFAINSTTPRDQTIALCYQNACLQLGLKSSATAVWQSEIATSKEMADVMLEQIKHHPEVTALICIGDVSVLATKIFRVPDAISIVGIYVSPTTPKTNPPLTEVTLREGEECIGSWACTEIISQIQNVESGRPSKPPRRVFFVPELIIRKSTRSIPQKKTGSMTPSGHSRGPHTLGSPGDSLPQPANPWESWQKVYPFVKKHGTRNWRQFDLSKLANHGMTQENSWLGSDPLLHFSPGLRSIHGVPFQVIEENLNGGRSVITFRSPHTHSTRGKQLPVKEEIAIGEKVKALYFLHACAWAVPVSFADYIIHFKTGKASGIPLAPIGPSLQLAHRRLGKTKPNLQDWWPGLKQQDFPHARYVTVFNPADPQEYQRTLYTLEWINPHPKIEVSRIEVRVDPAAGPALAIVAVTALI